MEKFNIGVFPFLILWGYAFTPSNSEYQNMVCEKPSTSREGRKLTQPGPECDMSEKDWCTIKTKNYPEEFLLEYILDNRGIMKKLFGDVREARYLQEAFSNNIYDEPYYPLPPSKRRISKKEREFQRNEDSFVNGRFPETEILANTRNGKKIDDGGLKNKKVVKYELYLEERKKTKFRNDLGKLKTKIETNNLPNRPNDKVFNSIEFDQSILTTAATTATTTTPPTTTTTTTTTTTPTTTTTTQSFPSDETLFSETTLTTPDILDETLSIEPTTLEENNFPTKPSKEFVKPFTSSETLETLENLEDEFELKKNEATTKQTTVISLDFGDELRYESKPILQKDDNSFRTENTKIDSKFNVAEAHKNSIEAKKHTIPFTTPSPTTSASTSSTIRHSASTSDLLKGRVEFRPSFTNPTVPNNQKYQYVRPGYPSAQTYQATPSYVNTPKEEPRPQSPPGVNMNPNPQMLWEGRERIPACNSTSEFISPAWAKNRNGKSLVVVNVGGFMQEVHIQQCKKDVVNRKKYCGRDCRCEQQYRYQKLLVFDPDDTCRGIFSEWFRFPSSCDCVCYKCPQTMSRDARTMAEMDYDDEEYEDFLEEDLNDPNIRFYYGLDLLDKEKVWNDFEGKEEEVKPEEGTELWDQNGEPEGDLEAAPSNQRIYQSFTDISSIDRSLSNHNSLNSNSNHKEGNNLNFDDKVENVIANNHNNSTLSRSNREKKSRLLKGFNRTVNVRPQIPPRRIPPPRSSVRPYSFPWMNAPSLSIWPSIAMYRSFNPYNNYNVPSGRSYDRDANRVVTEIPFNGTTIGTLNAATPPYFDWKRKQTASKDLSKDGKEKPVTLSRIPRNAKAVEQNSH